MKKFLALAIAAFVAIAVRAAPAESVSWRTEPYLAEARTRTLDALRER